MATYYVDGDSGNDANAGTSPSAPKKTLAAGVTLLAANPAAVDTLYIKGTFRNEWMTLSALSNKTVERWPGAGKPKFTHRLVTGSWTHIGANVYTATIGTGLTLTSLSFGWGQAVSATGGYYGFCRREASAAAVTAAASGGKGRYHYDSGTGLITAYFGGANPNTAGKEIGYATVSSTQAAVYITGCANIVVRGLWIGPLPVHTGQFGWAVWAELSDNVSVQDVEGYDLGAHASGGINATSVVTVASTFIGLAPNGTHIVCFHTTWPGTPIGTVARGCDIRTARYRGIDDEVLDGRGDAVGALDNNTQVCVYAHTDSGSGMNMDIEFCVFTSTETGTGVLPWAIDNANAADLDVPSSFPLRIFGGMVVNFQAMNVSPGGTLYLGSWRCRGVVFVTTKAALQGYGVGGQFFTIAAGTSVDLRYLIESCVFIGPLGGTGQTRFCIGQTSTGGFKRMRFVQCSFYATSVSSDLSAVFDGAFESVQYFEAYRCVFGFNGGNANTCLYMWETAASITGNPIRDCLYFGVGANRYAQVSGYTATQWVTNVDIDATVGVNVLSTNPYANTSTLEPTAAVYALTAVSTAPAPVPGINGAPYAGDFGAWQQPRPRRRIPPAIFRLIDGGATAARAVGVGVVKAGGGRP